jgi:hypothetical protein
MINIIDKCDLKQLYLPKKYFSVKEEENFKK